MRYRINSPKVIHQIFDTEVVIVNLESGNYYSVRGSGIDIWRHLDAGKSADEIVDAFGSASDASVKVRKFLEELAHEQLIVAANDDVAARDISLPGTFADPTLEKFSDMRDLLLLDPIHELDESGWPRNRPPVPEKK